MPRNAEEEDEDLVYLNPYFHPTPGFYGAFHITNNLLMSKLVNAYHIATKKINDMLPQYKNMIQAVDVVSQHLAKAQVEDVNIDENEKE